MSNTCAIAIDGPSAAGKSTIARRIAGEFGFLYVDTGALYRAIGLAAVRRGKNPKLPQEVLPILPGLELKLAYVDGVQRVFLGGEDVSEAIRTPEMSAAAAAVAASPQVRAVLRGEQREPARTHSVVMDGRDIGTVILPEAKVKIFLTATPERRAARRYQEYLQKGVPAEYDQVLKEILERDANDISRETAPLRQAEDAVLVDSSDMTLEEAVRAIKAIVEERC